MRDATRPRPVIGYLTMLWGAIWSVTLGAIFLAPRLLALHHLRPASAGQWVLVDLVLLAMFVLVGTAVSFVASAPIVVWRQVRRRPWPHPGWLAAFASFPLLAAGYAAAGFGVAWAGLGRAAAVQLYDPLLAPVVVTFAGGVALFLVAYRRLVFGPSPLGVWRFAAYVLAAGVGAFAVLPLRVAAGDPAAAPGAEAAPVQRVSAPAARPPLLVVGLDSGNWATLDPLLARHRLPALERLIATGVHGPMKAEWAPYWSRPAWATILTGYDRDDTGIHEDLAAHIPGLPWFEVPLELDPTLAPLFAVEYVAGRAGMLRVAPPPRMMLQRPPFWETLEEHGLRTAVVRFDFSYPATGTASVVVSNRVGHDAWDLMKVIARNPMYPVVAPEQEAAALLAPFQASAPPDPAEWARLAPPGPHVKPRDAVIDPERVLRIAYDIDRQSFNATERIIRRHRDLSAVALYLPGFDGVCHAFWPYRFPEQYPSAPPGRADVRRLGPVLDRYLEFVDARLARLLALFGRTPNVVLVSDHGHTAITGHPIWRGWHGPEAIFIASGPSFPHSDVPVHVSYFDITPTILATERVPAGDDLPGHPLMQPAAGARRAERADDGPGATRRPPGSGS